MCRIDGIYFTVNLRVRGGNSVLSKPMGTEKMSKTTARRTPNNLFQCPVKGLLKVN